MGIPNECSSERSSYGLHCSCITAQSSGQCCHCGQAKTLCVSWIHEDDLELRSEIPKYCDHDYCHGRGGALNAPQGFVLDVVIDRLPSGNFNMLNKRGYLICRVADGSKLAEFIEKQFENKTGSFTLTMQLKKP